MAPLKSFDSDEKSVRKSRKRKRVSSENSDAGGSVPVVKHEDAGVVKAEEKETVLPENIEFSTVHSRRKFMTRVAKEKKKAKKESQQKRRDERKRLGKKAPPKMVPKTIESMREPDVTMKTGDEEEDAEVAFDEAGDEMAEYFNKSYEPKVLITTSEKPTSTGAHFAKDLAKLITNGKFFLRKRTSIKGTVEKAKANGYTDIIVVNEERKECNGLLLIHLPDGPTAHFKLSSAKATDRMRKKWEFFGHHRPEIILNNFSTKLGHRVARMLASLFHYDPEFKGRRVVTFHNQRDYIFFRHHRYEFKNGKKVALKELGPRFTLKLRSLQRGTFDSKHGEYEWIHRRGEMDTSRRRFHL